MKYSLPYAPGLYDIITELPDDTRLKIDDIYFSDPSKSISNRDIKFSPEYWDEIKRIKDDFGIKLNYVVNSAVYDNDIYSASGVDHMLRLFYSVWREGCEVITFNNTVLLRDETFFGNLPPMVVKTSTNNKIGTLESVKFCFENIGLRHFILDRAINRNLEELQRVHEWTKERNITLTVMANEGCLPSCVWKQHCDNLISQYPKQQPAEVQELQMWHKNHLCTMHYQRNPADTLKSPFITPAGLKLFEPYADSVKIVGRMIDKKRLKTLVTAYMYGNSSFSLYDFFATTHHVGYRTIYFSDLETLGYSEKVSTCRNQCVTCNFCDKVFETILKEKGNG
jgi:collagenase-like PrtC family protease